MQHKWLEADDLYGFLRDNKHERIETQDCIQLVFTNGEKMIFKNGKTFWE